MKPGREEVVAEEDKRRRKDELGKSTSESLKSDTGERGYSQVPIPGGMGSGSGIGAEVEEEADGDDEGFSVESMECSL